MATMGNQRFERHTELGIILQMAWHGALLPKATLLLLPRRQRRR
jgi:hypothetical protein